MPRSTSSARSTSSRTDSPIRSTRRSTRTFRRSASSVRPPGNDGLGLMLLGVTGYMVLPADVYARIKAETISQVRGTVQADILKEDQAQNTCIFSTEFSLK